MSTFDNILAKALQLSASDRVRLIDLLWDTIPEDQAMTLSPEWMAEIERRSAEYDAGDDKGVPWEEVRAAALKRISQMERKQEE